MAAVGVAAAAVVALVVAAVVTRAATVEVRLAAVVVVVLLPFAFFASDYTLYDYWQYGLEPPPPGFEWVRVGPDALLVRPADGYVLDAVRDLFY